MKKIAALIVLWCFALSVYAQTKPLNLSLYQTPEGAITIGSGGDYVDPYFAIRALLTAHHAGMDITQPAHAWISWLLPRQEKSGLFKRFCWSNRYGYRACAAADADDALLAMWVELLYVMSPNTGMPTTWKKSVDLANKQLAPLLNKNLGVYFIAKNNPVGLLMDNIEIADSLFSTSQQQQRLGLAQLGQQTALQAAQLKARIEVVFHPDPQSAY